MEQRAAEKLVEWFQKAKRSMAWRDDPTPYHVLVSEIMLQQTRVETVHPYYAAFIETFPDVYALSEAPDDLLYKRWEGLGYYSRARNLRNCASTIVSKYAGRVPDTYDELLSLPGIGPYTAGAILSIAYHKPYPVVDGNVLRVVSRLSASTSDVKEERTLREMGEALGGLLKTSALDPSAFNQALMELGALICVPNGRPKCEDCPLHEDCEAKKRGLTDSIPVMSKKSGKRIEDKTVFLIRRGEKTALVRMEEQRLLSLLYGYPSVGGHRSEDEVKTMFDTIPVSSVRRLADANHVFTHIVWKMTCFEIELFSDAQDQKTEQLLRTIFGETLFFADEEEIRERYALPSAFKKW